MSQRRRVTLGEVRALEAELHGAYVLLAVILKGVGGELLLSRQEMEELAEVNPQIKAYDLIGTEAFLIRLETEDGQDDE
jgi:hypothetical protein